MSIPHLKIEPKPTPHKHSDDHTHSHEPTISVSGKIKTTTYSHKHHSGDKEHAHQQDVPHPPVEAPALGNFENSVAFADQSVRDIVLIQPDFRQPDDPYLNKVFRPPIL